MRALLFLSTLVPVALAAQSIQTIRPEQCLWHMGDDPAWARPNLDDSDWQPWTEWKPEFAHPRLWVRCHVDLATMRNDVQPAIQVGSYSAYELYRHRTRYRYQ